MMKLRNKAGFTLMEMMVSIAIIVILVMGIGTSMDSGLKIYNESMFESNSGVLSGIINTSLGDMLRHAENITALETPIDDVEFVFTNAEYGVADAYFYTGDDDSPIGILQLKHRDGVVDLINEGAYPNLAVTNFKITYTAPGSTETPGEIIKRGGYFHITYDIVSTAGDNKTRSVETIIRLLNT